MSKVIVDKQKIDLLANAISAKSGEPLTMTLDEMIESVDGIEEGGCEPNLETKSVTYTPTTSQQTDTVTASSGYDGLEEVDVTVNAVPLMNSWEGYISRNANDFTTQNNIRYWRPETGIQVFTSGWLNEGTYSERDNFNAIASNVSITPTESSQTIGGAFTMMEGAVTVNAIPSNYVGSGITQRSSTDLTASGATVTVPSGYYSAQASKAVSSGSATAPATISGTSATVSTGTNTLTLSKTVSVTPSVTAGYVSSGTAGNSSVSLTASVTTQGAQTIYPSTSDQTIASGRYLTGAQTIKAVSQTNLSADNIKSGTTITISNGQSNLWSVTGTYTGGGGGSASIDTKTVTASNYPVSISFSSMKGQPKAFFLRSTSQIASSGSTTYYYIMDMVYDGNQNNFCNGNTFRIGSTRRIDPVTTATSQGITTGYTWSYTGTTLTITSSAASRSASPGAFNNGYQLVYIY